MNASAIALIEICCVSLQGDVVCIENTDAAIRIRVRGVVNQSVIVTSITNIYAVYAIRISGVAG